MLLELLSGIGIRERDSIIQKGMQWLEQNSEYSTEVMRVSKLFNDATSIESVEREKEFSPNTIVEEKRSSTVIPRKTKTLATRALHLGQRLLFQQKGPQQSERMRETPGEARTVLGTDDHTKNVYIVVTIEEWQCLWAFIDSLKSRAHLAEEENRYLVETLHG